MVLDDMELLVQRHGRADMPGDSIQDGSDFESRGLWGGDHEMFFAVGHK